MVAATNGNGVLPQFTNSHGKYHNQNNNWLHPGQAAFDFRGDVRTSPTGEMLDAITHATLLDGIDRSDHTTNHLEEYMAQLAGKEAALFVPSGTMGNLLSLRSLLNQPPYAVLCDDRAHTYTNEAGGAFAFAGALPHPVHASNGRHLTLEDIIPHIPTEPVHRVHACPIRVIALENTLRGMILPLAEVKRICGFAQEHGIKMHLDGARLWEAVEAEHISLSEYCAGFDTISLCFSKGLGAPVGAVVVGSASIVEHARWLRQSIGGSLRQPGLLTAAALVAVQHTFQGGLLRRTHTVAADLASFWTGHGGRLKYPTETNMLWLDLERERFTLEQLIDAAGDAGIFISRDRLVVHYQISDDAVEMLKEVMDRLLKRI